MTGNQTKKPFNTTITSEDGKDLKAYVAAPPSGTGPGLIMMHEVYGVTQGLTELADYMATQGFIVACPNMYWRENPEASFMYDPPPEILAAMPEAERAALEEKLTAERVEARNLMFNIVGNTDPAYLAAQQDGVLDTINKVAAYLRGHDQGNGLVASSGFCFGARNTYLAMAHGADVDAGIVFYPTPKLHEVFDHSATMAIEKPMMMVVGGQDGYIGHPEGREDLDEKEHMIVGSAAMTLNLMAGRLRPVPEVNPNGNPNILSIYCANNDHGMNRRRSKYSDLGTSEHLLKIAAEFIHAGAGLTNTMVVPARAFSKMPVSPTYQPAYKV
jgi:carboxymethylenebutenolidase